MRFVFFILYLCHFLPVRVLHLLAKFIGWGVFYLAGARRKVGEINLALCFPEWSAEKRIQVLRAHFYHMSALFLEYSICWYSSAKRIASLVCYENKHYLDEVLAQNKHVILLYPHFSAFEMGVYKLNQDVPLISMYAHQKNQAVDKAVFQHRHRYNNVFIVSRQEGFKSLIKTIRKQVQAPFLYLPDQDFGSKDSIFVRFFGVKTATITGLNRLARLTGAKIIPLIPVREGHRFRLEFHRAWLDFPSDDVVTDTQRMNDFIEEQIRKYPEQYFWLHKRFKTRPEGGERYY